MSEPLEQLAADLVSRALRSGATAADVVVRDGDEFTATVRMRQIESVKEAASRVVSLRVFVGTRSASSYSQDFSHQALERLVERTVAMARATSEDPASGLPQPEELGRYEGDLKLYDPSVAELSTDERIGWARRAEEAALSADERIRNSEGASFESTTATKVYANSLGFAGQYSSSYCGVTVIPVAANGPGSPMQRDYWYTNGRRVSALESPESVGKKAAERAVRRLGARKIATRRVPVVFDSEAARSLVGHLFEAVRGDAIYRSASFLAGKLGERIAGENVTLLDDGLRAGGFGSRPFDDEGIPASTVPVIERGVLTNYLLNTYAARKLNRTTTGNASRGIAGPPAVGPKNLYLAPGPQSPEEIVRSVEDGFYVTELFGFGVNIVTGDYSRGAAGLWIERGEPTYPVEEVTIAGSLPEMLRHIGIIGSDLDFRGSVVSPTLLVEGLTVAGS